MNIRIGGVSVLALLLSNACLHAPEFAAAQDPAAAPALDVNAGGKGANNALGNGFGFGNGPGGGLNGLLGTGGEGAAANADFDSLIDLIVSTVEHDSWMENGTGEGEIQPFPNGVWADAAKAATVAVAVGSVKPTYKAPSAAEANVDPTQASERRYVSLPRLEAEIVRRLTAREPLDDAMLALAGLRRVEHVLVDEQARDLVLVGPAGAWVPNDDAQLVSATTGRPIVRLDDLLTIWRHGMTEPKPFGCSINPRREGLERTQDYVRKSAETPLEPGERGDWLAGLRESLGKQDTEFFNIDPESRVARVLLAADYHMKLIGMGLVEAVPGVRSYLATVDVDAEGNLPPMTVLRWWFAMKPGSVTTDAARGAFRIPAGGVQVLSENELLAARGQRVHTGQSEELNRRFAESFSVSFDEIAEKYPLYRELEQVFSLALVVEVVRREGLTERAGWLPSVFAYEPLLRLPKVHVPKEVESVINHRVVRRRHVVAGVSGGVWADAAKSLKVVSSESAETPEREAQPADSRVWWWD